VTPSWPEVDRRNPHVEDRRGAPRGGRRDSDLPRPVTCTRCDSPDVRGVGRIITRTQWCHCRNCGYVWQLLT
jgi:hypothetical protein